MNQPEVDPTGLAPVSGVSGVSPNSTVTKGNPAFRALLDRLEATAAELRRQEASITSADELADAVSVARDSFAGALELGRDLLESLKQAQLQAEPQPEAEASDNP